MDREGANLPTRQTARIANRANAKRKLTVMAYASDNRTATLGLGDRFSEFVAHVQRIRAQRKLYRTTYNELAALTDKELADIGVARSSIRSIALSAANMTS